MTCKELTELATDYLEANLGWLDHLRVRAHLWMCTHCRAYLDQMRKVIGLLLRVPKEPAPPKLAETLLPEFRKSRKKQG